MPGSNPISEDLNELIRLLINHKVEFLIVGAHALAFYVPPRFTEDLDVLVRRTETNGKRLQGALSEFGIPISDEARDELILSDKRMIILGAKPNRVDLLNHLDGVQFESACERANLVELAGNPVSILSLEDIIATKQASGRPRDLVDLAMIREHHGG